MDFIDPPLYYALILLFSASYYANLASCRPHNNFTDVQSLLAFRDRVIDRNGILATNWTTDTSFCSWIGVQCSRRRQRVSAIRLPGFALGGAISPHVANLSFLSELVLSNNSLTGPIPEGLDLKSLILESNFLTGNLPSTIFNITPLVNMYVGSNNLSGTLPLNSSFTALPRLRNISLSSNHLTGDIVLSAFALCPELQMLSLSENHFVGGVPDDIDSLSGLKFLYLGKNQLSGTIPASLGNLTELTELDLDRNKLSGVIPEELGNLHNLQYLALQFCNLSGSIPIGLLNCSLLNFFDLSYNELTGHVPVGIGKSLPLLNWFNVGSNQLGGNLEFLDSLSGCRNLEFLQIWENKLEGALPDSIGNLSSSLQLFLAFENSISGNIPSALGNLSGLTFMSLHMNELTGSIPSAITKLHSLQSLVLAFNRISGSIPPEIGLLTNLNVLDLHYNAVTGSIPDTIANITKIQHLWLHSNKMSSTIPESLWTLSSLLELYLSENTLNGSLSPQVGNLKELTFLDLSMNELSGNIPSALGALQMLTDMDLSRNSLQGQIPNTFNQLFSVINLNLSHNFLSGLIPDSLANLSYLDSLDLSFNKLEGRIPNGRVFSNLSISSLIGNQALCGAPSLRFPPCSKNVATNSSTRKLKLLKYILPFTAFGIILACLGLTYIFNWKRKAKTSAKADDAHLHDNRVISQRELLRATSNFSEANLLGRGGFGSVCRGCLDDGMLVAVKVLNLEAGGALKSFDAECQVLRTVRHRNLIKIISVCSTINFKALILQFMSNGSLDKWLYSGNYFLNLPQRLNIMLDVSLALEYLHHHHPHVVLHCDLKPTNVLLDEKMVAHVSDFGIAKLLFGDSSSIISASTPGTIGYIAPGNEK
ncbi:uncharacterized protein A4U43_C01F32780 [Asparagus officinalis]|uniref:non-specific serine/threonine protein kinase n=1 Tax=Asparagus officinalis TaxID=4686 RepID=A0A5P1FU72_ASPOF|nr:uncharacterized protein A4U43_C01F32780 [Asparagus officinalis]